MLRLESETYSHVPGKVHRYREDPDQAAVRPNVKNTPPWTGRLTSRREEGITTKVTKATTGRMLRKTAIVSIQDQEES